MEYFIIENNGQQAGPFSLEQLVQKAITPETLVWAQGMKDWTPAWKIAELKTVLETVEAIKANANKENAEGTSADAAGNNGTEAANFQAANQQGFQQAQQEAYQQGFLHGGVVTSLADVSCGYAALTTMPDNAEVLTVEFKINLVRAANTSKLIATGEIIKAGRTLVVAESTVTDSSGENVIAKMLATMIVSPVTSQKTQLPPHKR